LLKSASRRAPTAISLLALFFALGGTAIAAKHFLITSTKQIKPSVLTVLKGKTGKTGPAGKTGATGERGAQGPQGERGVQGERGGQGERGLQGEKGEAGAVAGYAAAQTESATITSDEHLTQIPGLTKTLPAGSFIASGTVQITAKSPSGEPGYAGAECALMDKAGAKEVQAVGDWASDTAKTGLVEFAAGEISFDLAISTSESSTLSVKCREAGHGHEVEIEAVKGSAVAVETSSNT
jgi:hypothetical protein